VKLNLNGADRCHRSKDNKSKFIRRSAVDLARIESIGYIVKMKY